MKFLLITYKKYDFKIVIRVHVNQKPFHLVGPSSNKPDLLNIKNQTNNTPEFIQAWNEQTDFLKDLYYNNVLNADMVYLSNRKELIFI